MTRRKVLPEKKLTRKITIRLDPPFYNKLEKWRAQSNCRTVTEIARKILIKERVIWYHKNAELESLAIELALIRKELNAMGKNINQITHHFHIADNAAQRMFNAMKAADEFKKVGVRVDNLFKIISGVSKKWLQG